MIHIYTDGGVRGNGKQNAVGSSAFVVVQQDKIIHEYSCKVFPATNNISELTAIIYALQYCLKNEHFLNVKLFSDSQYAVKGYNHWIFGWKRRNWINSEQQPVKNQDLWEELWHLKMQLLQVEVEWVKGHADNPYNNRADQLCQDAFKALKDVL